MSTETETSTITSTTTKAQPQVGHGEMFFRYIAALCQTAGVQAFTFAIAVPKDDGTSSIMSVAAGPPQATQEWKDEVAKLLSENAATAAASIVKAPAPESDKAPEVV